jgi:hypothetical protein
MALERQASLNTVLHPALVNSVGLQGAGPAVGRIRVRIDGCGIVERRSQSAGTAGKTELRSLSNLGSMLRLDASR